MRLSDHSARLSKERVELTVSLSEAARLARLVKLAGRIVVLACGGFTSNKSMSAVPRGFPSLRAGDLVVLATAPTPERDTGIESDVGDPSVNRWDHLERTSPVDTVFVDGSASCDELARALRPHVCLIHRDDGPCDPRRVYCQVDVQDRH